MDIATDLKTFLAAKCQELSEMAVERHTRKLIEEAVREEISKFMQRFMFVIAAPRKEDS